MLSGFNMCGHAYTPKGIVIACQNRVTPGSEAKRRGSLKKFVKLVHMNECDGLKVRSLIASLSTTTIDW